MVFKKIVNSVEVNTVHVFDCCPAVLITDLIDWYKALKIIQGGPVYLNVPQKTGQTQSRKAKSKSRKAEKQKSKSGKAEKRSGKAEKRSGNNRHYPDDGK